MILKTKTLAAITAVAVSGILGNTASAASLATQMKLLQAELTKLYPNAVLVSPTGTNVYATDQQLADAVLAVTKEKNPKKKLSVTDAVSFSVNLAATSDRFHFATTTILQKVVSGVSTNPTKLAQAVSATYSGVAFSSITDNSSASADLVGTALLGLKDSGITKASDIDAAIKTIVKTAIKGASTVTAGSTVGAAAQYSNLTTLARFSTLITVAVSKAADDYQGIAQAVATAAQQIFSTADFASGDVTNKIKAAVLAGYAKDYGNTHRDAFGNPKKLSDSKAAPIIAMIDAAVNTGLMATTGAGAAGLANYTFANLQNGPVTDIYGL